MTPTVEYQNVYKYYMTKYGNMKGNSMFKKYMKQKKKIARPQTKTNKIVRSQTKKNKIVRRSTKPVVIVPLRPLRAHHKIMITKYKGSDLVIK